MIVFISNKLTLHQIPFCENMYARNPDFYFVEVKDVGDDRYPNDGKIRQQSYAYLALWHEERARCLELIDKADLLIVGLVPLKIVRGHLKKGKPVLRYSERPMKTSSTILKKLLRYFKWHIEHPPQKPIYMLCASAYTAMDYARFGLYKNKVFRWGYFPPVNEYPDVKQLIATKQPNTIVWAARMIDWKHPELALEIARRLKTDGFDFELNMIGSGELLENIQNKVQTMDLGDRVKLPGSMPPEQVRKYMEQSAIFLMTSDRQEGWGAVLNEAMNSACAVVANSATGAAPYLVKDGENGFLYNENNLDDLYQKVRLLLENPKTCAEMGEKAYHTITEQWNAENAAQRLIALSEKLLRGEDGNGLFSDGICSTAPLLEDGWYQPTEM